MKVYKVWTRGNKELNELVEKKAKELGYSFNHELSTHIDTAKYYATDKDGSLGYGEGTFDYNINSKPEISIPEFLALQPEPKKVEKDTWYKHEYWDVRGVVGTLRVILTKESFMENIGDILIKTTPITVPKHTHIEDVIKHFMGAL